jgi:hypothetical protein
MVSRSQRDNNNDIPFIFEFEFEAFACMLNENATLELCNVRQGTCATLRLTVI